MALLKIIIGSFIAMFVAWSSIQFWGKNQRFIEYDHPMIKADGPWVMAYGGESSSQPSHTLPAMELALQQPQVWLAVDIWLSSETHFYAIPQGFRSEENKKPWVKWTDAEIEALNAGDSFKNADGTLPFHSLNLKFQKLETLLNKYPKTQFFLWFRDNERDLDLIIASFLKRIPNLENRVLIYSDFDVVMKSLKDQLPRWVYGTPNGERTRFMMFDSLGLESSGTLLGDFYFSPLKNGTVKMLSQSMQVELKRRMLPLIVGPLDTESDIQEALKYSPKGFLTSRSAQLVKILSEKSKEL